MSQENGKTVGVVGLGYVGLPLALAFGKKLNTVGFDINANRINQLREGWDISGETSQEEFTASKKIQYTCEPKDLKNCDFVVVAVPTPVNDAKQPDLSLILDASRLVGQNLKKGAIVIFESTVYPGTTEDVCIPALEKASGLKNPVDFKVGYSPERINPGDKLHTIDKIVKVVSAQDAESLQSVKWLYEQIVDAGVYPTTSIAVAEAAKVIENTQRDLNIALMNELAIIFGKLNIDTAEVLGAAGSKWNFLNFRPGLVGGHCIGVDPYYLTYRAEQVGYHPEVILAGRRINDSMGKYIADQTVKQIIIQDRKVKSSNILVMGLAFKENCRDLRNSRVIDIISELKSYQANVYVWDPIVDRESAQHEYGIDLIHQLKDLPKLDAVVAAVSHTEVIEVDLKFLREKCESRTPFMDVKSAFKAKQLSELGFSVWRL